MPREPIDFHKVIFVQVFCVPDETFSGFLAVWDFRKPLPCFKPKTHNYFLASITLFKSGKTVFYSPFTTWIYTRLQNLEQYTRVGVFTRIPR